MPDAMVEALRVVRFGVFELDVRSGELRKGGVRLNLPDQPLQILTALLERPGEIVAREDLRQRLWPSDTFVDFEHGLNAAVKRLRDVLGDVADSPRFVETVPKRGYRFVAPVERTANPKDVESHRLSANSHSLTEPVVRSRRRHYLAAVPLIAIVGASVGLRWYYRAPPSSFSGPPTRVVPLTTLPGEESQATFSPDSEQLAFVWDGDKHDNRDIYVTIVGSSEVRRLTTDPDVDEWPSWSPDGRQIAFVRGCQIRIMSALGGSDRRLNDFPAGSQISWSPDGRYLAVARAPLTTESTGIYLVPVQGGEPRRLTSTTAPSHDSSPAFSPDGRRLAYASCGSGGNLACYLEVFDLDAASAPTGPARRLTVEPVNGIDRLAWTRDGTSLIYDGGFVSLKYLWRLQADGTSSAERIEVAGIGASGPATTPSRDRLAFSHRRVDTDIYRVEHGRPPQPVVASSFADYYPQFSPDGRHITFCSSRSGDAVEIWVAAADGSGAQQLTHNPGRWQCSPHWSPEGRRIAFDSQAADGRWHIWTMDADGGRPRQITAYPGSQNAPTWSRDGQWIYFSWDQGSGRDIWRTPATGGPHERITRGGSGFLGCESPDGRSLLYKATAARESPLLAVLLTGGPARQVVKCVEAFGKPSFGPQGVYYLACGSGPDRTVRVLHPDGQDESVGVLKDFSYGLGLSPDGATIMYDKVVVEGSDLMLIENFK